MIMTSLPSEQAVVGMILNDPSRIIPVVTGRVKPSDCSNRVCATLIDAALQTGQRFDDNIALNALSQMMPLPMPATS